MGPARCDAHDRVAASCGGFRRSLCGERGKVSAGASRDQRLAFADAKLTFTPSRFWRNYVARRPPHRAAFFFWAKLPFGSRYRTGAVSGADHGERHCVQGGWRARVWDTPDFVAGVHHCRWIRRRRRDKECTSALQRELHRTTCAERRRHTRCHILRRLSIERYRKVGILVRWNNVATNRGASAYDPWYRDRYRTTRHTTVRELRIGQRCAHQR